MLKKPSFYSVIIGTELLNMRRRDSHFTFINQTLIKRGWEHKANFMIKDDTSLLENVYKLVQEDPNSVMFSFGGIGSTPDDFTRDISAKAFTDKALVRHKLAEEIIIHKLQDRAYPHPIKMADLPVGAKLIDNPINKMPGYQLEDRFFFVPGFPQMAHPMIDEVLDNMYPQNVKKYSCNFIVYGSEASLIDIMEQLPQDLELSCLPAFDGEKRTAEIYLTDTNQMTLKKWCTFFKTQLHKIQLHFKELD